MFKKFSIYAGEPKSITKFENIEKISVIGNIEFTDLFAPFWQWTKEWNKNKWFFFISIYLYFAEKYRMFYIIA